jgi:hypothetical protein
MNKLIMGSLLITLALLGQGCGSKGGGFQAEDAPVDTTNLTPNTPRETDGDRGSDFAAGATAALDVDMTMLAEYAVTHPLNYPTDIKLSVKLAPTASGVNAYAGQVSVSYYDNGQYYTGRFFAKNTTNVGSRYNGWNQAYYNNWLIQTDPNSPSFGKLVFHGFFEDQYGAIMLVIDDAIDQGDGLGAQEVTGSIWFKNHPNTQFARVNPSVPCWFVEVGPYDCRTLLVSGNKIDWNNGKKVDVGRIDSSSAFLPTDSKFYTGTETNAYAIREPARGWKKLGTFSGLNKLKAFGQ